MKKFSFRLESALRLRVLRVEAEKGRLTELTLQLTRLEKALEALNEERTQAAQSVYASPSPTAADLQSLAIFNLGAQSRSRQMAEGIDRARNAVTEAQQRLLLAKRDQEIVERLRSKRLQEWTLQAERKIENITQELWLLTHTKSS